MTPSADIDVEISCAQWPNGLTPQLVAAARATLHEAGAETENALAIRLADDAEVQTLNARYRAKDKPTNVLSFPAPEWAAPHLGDIILAYETIAREATEQGKSFDHHALHLAVHGMLHLLGYDHESEDQAEEMETLERRILAQFAIEDPYA